MRQPNLLRVLIAQDATDTRTLELSCPLAAKVLCIQSEYFGQPVPGTVDPALHSADSTAQRHCRFFI